MKDKEYILLEQYCKNTPINDSFIHALIEFDVIAPKQQQNDFYILEDEILEIERLFRLHDDLGVNVEGLGVINEMMSRMQQLESEMENLRKRLSLYE